MSDSDPHPLVGTVLGRSYRIEELIGRGAMGLVFRATHLRLPRQVAIKLLHTSFADKAVPVARFEREATITCEIGHPHIVEVLDFDRNEEGQPFLVMELLEGEDLTARLGRRGRLSVAVASSIAQQTCSALQAAHEAGVVHRDLKPGNLFLCWRGDRDDYVKLTDFGIASIRGSMLTGTGAAMGTPAYMSPEQASGRSAGLDARADVFALGVMLYEMLGGALPFVGEDLPDTLHAIVYGDPPGLRTLRPELPAAMEELVHRCLAKRPDQRPPSAAALGRALGRALDASDAPWRRRPPEVAELPSRGAETLQVRRRVPLVPLLVGVAALGIAAVVWLVLTPGAGPREPSSPRPPSTPRALPASPRSAAPGPRDGAVSEADATKGARPDARAVLPNDAGQADGAEASTDASPLHRTRRPRVARGHGRVHLRPATLRIVTKSRGEAVWAEIEIDGKPVGQSPLSLRRRPGRHRITIRRFGYKTARRTVILPAGGNKALLIELAPAANWK